MTSSNDKWSALLDDDWDKPLTTTNNNKTNPTISDPLQSTTTPAAVKYEIKQSYTGSNSMTSYFHNDNKPKVQILTKRNNDENAGDDGNNKNLHDKEQDTKLSQAEKLALYNETKRRIFNEGKK